MMTPRKFYTNCIVSILTVGVFLIYIFTRPDIITIERHGDYDFARSVEDMIDSADYIVKGQFGDMVNIDITTYEIGDSDETVGHIENVYRTYEFHVSEVIDGQIEEEIIQITRSYSSTHEIYEDGTETVEIPSEFYFEPDSSVESIVFLAEIERNGLFIFSHEPGVFIIEDDGTLQVQSTVVNLSQLEFEPHITDQGERVVIEWSVPQIEDTFSGLTEDEFTHLVEERD